MIISIVGTKRNDNNLVNLNHLIYAKVDGYYNCVEKSCLYLHMMDGEYYCIYFNTEEEAKKALDFILEVSA